MLCVRARLILTAILTHCCYAWALHQLGGHAYHGPAHPNGTVRTVGDTAPRKTHSSTYWPTQPSTQHVTKAVSPALVPTQHSCFPQCAGDAVMTAADFQRNVFRVQGSADPCQFRFFNQPEGVACLGSSWVALYGDSHLRAVWMAMLNILDQDQSQTQFVDNALWFNASETDFPHWKLPWRIDAGNILVGVHVWDQYGKVSAKRATTYSGKILEDTHPDAMFPELGDREHGVPRVTFRNLHTFEEAAKVSSPAYWADAKTRPRVVIISCGAWQDSRLEPTAMQAFLRGRVQDAHALRRLYNMDVVWVPRIEDYVNGRGTNVSLNFASSVLRVLDRRPTVASSYLRSGAYNKKRHWPHSINMWDAQRLLDIVCVNPPATRCNQRVQYNLGKPCWGTKEKRLPHWKNMWTPFCGWTQATVRA